MFHCSSYLPHSNGTVAVVPVQVREIHRASIEEQGWGSILPAPPWLPILNNYELITSPVPPTEHLLLLVMHSTIQVWRLDLTSLVQQPTPIKSLPALPVVIWLHHLVCCIWCSHLDFFIVLCSHIKALKWSTLERAASHIKVLLKVDKNVITVGRPCSP